MLKQIKRYGMSLGLLLLVTFIFPVIAGAETGVSYGVKANLPENQRAEGNTFFDLTVKPGMEQDLSLTISNNSKEEATFTVAPHVGTTNDNGVIVYDQTPKNYDPSLKAPFTQLVTPKQTVVVGANASKDVVFKLKVPKESFEGIILGGFHVQKQGEEPTEKENAEGVALKNEFAYVVGVRLEESVAKVAPELQLGEVTPTLVNYRTAVTANFQNTAPRIIKGLTINASISKKGSNEILYKAETENLMMAPNSNFNYAIMWGENELVPGTYVLRTTTDIKEEGYSQSFEKEFTITKEAAKKANKEAVELEVPPVNYFFYMTIGLLVLILLLVLGFILYLHKKKKAEEIIAAQQGKK